MKQLGALLFMTAALALVSYSPAQVSGAKSTAVDLAGYRIVNAIPMGGEGVWDRMALDASTRRLYIPRDNRVTVFDIGSQAVIGEIPNTQGVHGVALAPELGRGFTSNGSANTVTIFDLATLRTIGTVKTGRNPDAIVYDGTNQLVFTMNSLGKSVTAIKALNGSVVGNIPLVDDPDGAVADGKGHLYVNLADPAEVAVIDIAGLSVRRRITLAPCQEPKGIAIDLQKRRLFSVCSNEMMTIVDADRGQLVSRVPIGGLADTVVFDPVLRLIFSCNGEGTVTILSEESADKFVVLGNMPTKRGARIMALDTTTHQLFVATAEFKYPTEIEEWHSIVPNSFVLLVAAN